MQNKVMARVLATMMAATAAVSTASVPMMVAPIVAMADGETASNATTKDTTAKTTISVSNVEEGATVKAYQLVDGTYRISDGALVQYDLTTLASGISVTVGGETKEVKLSDLTQYSDNEGGNTDLLAAWTAEVAKKAANATGITTYTLTTTQTGDACTYSYADAEPGLYLVLVSKSDTTTVYNPALLAVNIEDANTVTSSSVKGSSVDMTGYFHNGKTNAYIKKTTNGFEKSIVKTTDAAAGTTEDVKWISAAVGETINFKLGEMILPSYSDQYADKKYVITDTLESKDSTKYFTGIADLKIKVGDTEYTATSAGNDTFTITEADGETAFTAGTSTSYQIAFATSYLAANAGKSVEITYSSSLTKDATLNFAENVNHAQLVYSYANGQSTTTEKKLVDNTYVYTFGIDSVLDSESDGSATKGAYVDYTLNKVTQAVGASGFAEYATVDMTTGWNQDYALSGAKFTLYTDATCKTPATCNQETSSSASDTIGHISFTELKAGTYYLKETEAPKTPKAYTINSTIYKIDIVPTVADTGIMSEYTINVYASTDGGQNFGSSTVGTFTIKADVKAAGIDESTGNIPYELKDHTITPVEIVNTILQQLPFTGGAGRYAIYIGSVALAAVFVVLFIVWRRREQDEQ